MSDEIVGEDGIESGASVSTRGSQSTPEMGWLRASVIAVGVFLYFAVLTVWLPSKVLRLDTVASSDQWVQNVAVIGTWSAPLLVGFVGLRWAQRRGLI